MKIMSKMHIKIIFVLVSFALANKHNSRNYTNSKRLISIFKFYKFKFKLLTLYILIFGPGQFGRLTGFFVFSQ